MAARKLIESPITRVSEFDILDETAVSCDCVRKIVLNGKLETVKYVVSFMRVSGVWKVVAISYFENEKEQIRPRSSATRLTGRTFERDVDVEHVTPSFMAEFNAVLAEFVGTLKSENAFAC